MTQAGVPQGEPQAPVAFGSTVTILFSDIRGFTEYTDAHGDEVAYRMLQHHNSLVQEQIELYGGHVVKTLGDSYMVSFEAARTAVTCAIAMQRALEQYNRAQQGPKIEIGVGIDTGEPVREAGDFFGGTVNRASRICGAAGSGRVLVSEVVRHVVGRMEGAEWIDRGFFEVKGFQEPQHLFEVDWSGAAAVRAAPVAPPPGTARPAAVSPPPAPAPSVPRVPIIGRPIPLVPVLIGGLLVLLALGAGGFLLLRPEAGGREAAPAAAPAPKLLFQDDFSDPGKGFFPPKEQGTQPNGVTYRQGYENGEYVMRLAGPSSSYGHAAVASSKKLFQDFAVEVMARSLSPKQALWFQIHWSYGEGDFYNFSIDPVQKTFLLCDRACDRPNTRGEARFLQEETPTTLRMELRGPQVKLLADGRLLDEVTVQDLARRGGDLALAVIAPKGGEVAVAFDNFKVYALAEPAASFPTPLPTPLPPGQSGVPKGALLFQAKLDGTGGEVQTPNFSDPKAVDVRFAPSAIEVVVSGQQTKPPKAALVFKTDTRQTYVGEYDLSFEPGSDMALWWEIRRDEAKQGMYVVQVSALSESMKLVYFDMKTSKEEALTSSIPLPGLRTGRVVKLTAVVAESRYTLFVDGRQVADVTDTRLAAPTAFGFTGHGKNGALRIHGARVYALGQPAASFPTPLPTPVPPTSLGVPKGALLFQAKLDGTQGDVQPYTLPNPQAADIRFVPGAIEVVVSQPAKAGAVFKTDTRQTYVGEYDLSFEPGSEMGLWWEIRRDDAKQGQYIVQLQTSSESLRLSYYDMKAGKEEPLTPPIPVSGLQTGRLTTLTAVVRESRYTLFVDGRQVADVTDTRLTGSTTFGFTGHGNKGTLRILGARVYGLP